MKFSRMILIALALVLPASWTVAHAEDAPSPGGMKGDGMKSDGMKGDGMKKDAKKSKKSDAPAPKM